MIRNFLAIPQDYVPPYVALRATVPADDVDALPALSIRVGGRAYPTQVTPALRVRRGDVDLHRTVEVCAVVPGVALVGDVAMVVDGSTPGSFDWQGLAGFYPAAAALRLEVQGVDAVYSARVDTDLSQLDEQGAVRLRDSFRARLRPESGSALLEHFGAVEGDVTAYSGLPMVEFDLLWHTAQTDAPIAEAFFRRLTLRNIPEGWVLVQRSEGSYIHGWTPQTPTRGRGSVDLIAPDVDPHTRRGQTAFAIRFALMREDALPHAVSWFVNPGYAFHIDLEGASHSVFRTHSITLDGFPFPRIQPGSDKEMGEFLYRARTGAKHPDQVHGLLGWYHSADSRWGGRTGGDAIEHSPGVLEYLTRSSRTFRFLDEVERAYLVRSRGFIAAEDDSPFEIGLWRAQGNASRSLNMVIGPAPAGEAVSDCWPSESGDPFRFRHGARNGPEGLGGLDEAEQELTGSPDAAHGIRAFGKAVALVTFWNDPLAQRILRWFGSAYRTDYEQPAGALYGPKDGVRFTRSEGWIAFAQAHDFACNGTARAFAWGEDFAGTYALGQFPHGSVLRWDNQRNKEVARASEGADEPVDAAQSYQSTIVDAGAFALLQIGCATGVEGLDLRDAIERSTRAALEVHWAPDRASPPYLFAVARHHGAPFSSWDELPWVSPEGSSYHVGYTLAIRLALAGASDELVVRRIRQHLSGGGPLLSLGAAIETAEKTPHLLRNREALLGIARALSS